MKKILSIVLSVAMLFGVLSINAFAEATPTVTIVTTKGSSVKSGTTTYFTVRLDNFSTIKGFDIEITAGENATFDTDYFEAVGISKSQGSNYNITEKKIHVVDLNNDSETGTTFNNLRFTAKVTATETATIFVTGKYAKDGATLFEIDSSSNQVEVSTTVAPTQIETPVDTSGAVANPVPIAVPTESERFIPYGSVFTTHNEKIVMAEKKPDGTFVAVKNTGADAKYSYTSYPVPTNDIITFGISEAEDNSSKIQFGNYIKSKAGYTYGTMVFAGEWLELKNYYVQKGYTVPQFVEALYKNVKGKLTANPDAKYVKYTLPSGKTVRVYLFDREKYMWKNTDGSEVEYALKLINTSNETYAGVAYGYNYDDQGNLLCTISQQVKSIDVEAQQ